jgi:hypothetical protein
MQRLNVLAINLAAKVSMSEPPPADVMMKVRRCLPRVPGRPADSE